MSWLEPGKDLYNCIKHLRRNKFFGIDDKYSDIAASLVIPRSTIFHHKALGVIIAKAVKLGENVQIYQYVTLGGRSQGVSKKPGGPVIGDNVIIYAHACILGGIRIGNNCIIGAYSLVLDDVPPNSLVYGIPAKIIRSVGKDYKSKGGEA